MFTPSKLDVTGPLIRWTLLEEKVMWFGATYSKSNRNKPGLPKVEPTGSLIIFPNLA